MRVLHLVGRSHRRGAEQVALELATELDRLGHDDRMAAVTAGHRGETLTELPALVPAAGQSVGSLLRATVALRRDVRRAPVDAVLAHGAAAALVAGLGLPRRGPALVWQRILGLAARSTTGALGAVWRLAVRRIDGVVALTRSMEGETRAVGFRGPVWVIPNARRVERFADLDRDRAGRELRHELGLDPGTHLVGLVGYLVEQKAPTKAIEVLAAVRGAGVDAHLVVAGDGPLRPAMEERAAIAGVSDSVSLLGHRDDVERLLGALDVLVLTSDDEGVPGVLIEAALAACPVVTFPVGDVAEVVDDGVTGVVLGAPSVAAMATAVLDLLRTPPSRRSMAAAAARATERHAMESVARRYDEVLQAVRARHGDYPR